MKQWQIAFRALLRRPGYSVTAILMLVLGIGATTTLFSVVDTILLKPLPYPNPDRLVTRDGGQSFEEQKGKPDRPRAPGRLEPFEPDLRSGRPAATRKTSPTPAERSRNAWRDGALLRDFSPSTEPRR